ncbi:Hypothetical predicted protein [Podarcis lilfordi]|uniref:Uncharacterized protein n=1 Tax=Podarcis lilfordi TaxID=74358 RepID=A0AA35L3R5_9SAUR|nr:Hypothetical predicted protein [Podarcis lilfordi]
MDLSPSAATESSPRPGGVQILFVMMCQAFRIPHRLAINPPDGLESQFRTVFQLRERSLEKEVLSRAVQLLG